MGLPGDHKRKIGESSEIRATSPIETSSQRGQWRREPTRAIRVTATSNQQPATNKQPLATTSMTTFDPTHQPLTADGSEHVYVLSLRLGVVALSL